MRDRVSEFAEFVKNAPTDQRAENIVRGMLEDVAKDCPMHVLVHLGQSLIECRRNELREQAGLN
jgi:hypothetical protein